jgi:hypothetical protein
MFYFVVAVICIYGLFRAYLDSIHVKNVDSIEQQLRQINDSLYSIKVRFKREKDDTTRE